MNALEELKFNANQRGWADSQFQLGNHYFTGAEGCEQSYDLALKWYLRAASQGHAKAQFALGYCYEFGEGIEQNQAEALFWYYAAYNNGDEMATERIKDLEEELPNPVIKQMKAKARRFHNN